MLRAAVGRERSAAGRGVQSRQGRRPQVGRAYGCWARSEHGLCTCSSGMGRAELRADS